MGEVKKFEPQTVGEGYRFDSDELLEEAKGQGFQTLVIISEFENGDTWISGSANAGESLIALELSLIHI